MGGSDVTESTRNAGRSRFSPRGQEDPLDKGMAPHSRILAWRMPWTGSLEGCSPWGRKESDTTEPLTVALFISGNRVDKPREKENV